MYASKTLSEPFQGSGVTGIPLIVYRAGVGLGENGVWGRVGLGVEILGAMEAIGLRAKVETFWSLAVSSCRFSLEVSVSLDGDSEWLEADGEVLEEPAVELAIIRSRGGVYCCSSVKLSVTGEEELLWCCMALGVEAASGVEAVSLPADGGLSGVSASCCSGCS